GHTFGLAHVLSSGGQEVMSYDSPNVRFINQTYDITDLNFNISTSTLTPNPNAQPKWYHTEVLPPLPHDPDSPPSEHPVPFDVPNNVTTQTSYTFLNAVLGARATAGDYANVADATAVDAGYVDATLPSVSVGSSVVTSLSRPGDYDVFRLSTGTSQWVKIDV